MMQKERLATGSLKLLLVIIALFFLFPFYWMLSSSFKEMSVAYQIPPEFFPVHPTIGNYMKLLETEAARWMLNSVGISVVTTLAVLVISSMAAYALAKIPFRGSKAIFSLLVGAMTIPTTVLLIPQFKIAVSLSLVNTYAGLIIHALASPYMIFLLRQFMMTIPRELLESARIDGCGEAGIFFRIMLPLSKPGLGAIAIFTFVASWNDYIWQLLIIKDTSMMTLPLGVATLINVESVDWGLIMAGSVLASLPVLIVFLAFQRYFVKGLTVGAVKG
ncbi:carbohydrate ABC transporter permease [Paenibacillus eucommiae]|uniref:Multiple sugar transport system permease protein n=1 Tax=Paenibacillus eucommiae TaxID=1355755 RepID=A0ABS4ISY4_9BACL|nr:carbohydrate ABC transporter permease [Paenibacillus eucommiae]MBP1990681.1 multiple sugar transport system permease protein [Paenibacillus eucommiae]